MGLLFASDLWLFGNAEDDETWALIKTIGEPVSFGTLLLILLATSGNSASAPIASVSFYHAANGWCNDSNFGNDYHGSGSACVSDCWYAHGTALASYNSGTGYCYCHSGKGYNNASCSSIDYSWAAVFAIWSASGISTDDTTDGGDGGDSGPGCRELGTCWKPFKWVPGMFEAIGRFFALCFGWMFTRGFGIFLFSGLTAFPLFIDYFRYVFTCEYD
jgi:hypothetical protein